MDVLLQCCAGLDVHRDSVVVCVLKGAPEARRCVSLKRTFGTMRAQLEELARWLKGEGCQEVALEGTGVYWMPVYAALEEAGLATRVCNARAVAKVPGRKTDMNDAHWLACLLRHGLVKPSFVPPKPLRGLREVLRYRRSLVEARSSERNRLLKLLETVGIKLAGVASDVFGVSGTLMLHALIEGTQTPAQMAGLARGCLRKKTGALELALAGALQPHQRDMLRMQLGRLQALEADITALTAQAEAMCAPYRAQLDLLLTAPGLERLAAMTLLAELGADMSVFPSPHHAAAWAGVAPGNDESGGKARPAATSRGNVHLKTVLVEAALSLSRSNGTYLGTKFHRLRARRGGGRAAMAIAHKLLVSAYCMLRDGVPYRELGADYLDRRNPVRLAKRLTARLRACGYDVQLTARPPQPPAHASA